MASLRTFCTKENIFFCCCTFIFSFSLISFLGCMDIDRTPFVYQQLKHAQTGIVLANELHLLYLATPIDPVDNFFLKWMLYYNQVIFPLFFSKFCHRFFLMFFENYCFKEVAS